MSFHENVMNLKIHVHVFGPLGLAVSRDYSYEPSDQREMKSINMQVQRFPHLKSLMVPCE